MMSPWSTMFTLTDIGFWMVPSGFMEIEQSSGSLLLHTPFLFYLQCRVLKGHFIAADTESKNRVSWQSPLCVEFQAMLRDRIKQNSGIC